MKEKKDFFRWHDVVRSTYSGIVAGFPSALCSRPILVIATPMHTEMKKNASQVIQAIYQLKGWKGFLSGLTPSLVATVPGTPLMYVGSRLTTEVMGETSLTPVVSGYVGMGLGCLAYVPPTIVNQAKQTLGVNTEIQQSSHMRIAQRLYAQKGIRGFYTGYSLQMVSFGTCNAVGLFFAAEISKYMQTFGIQFTGSTFAVYALGYTAAGFLTNPLELIKRQRQAAWANPSMFPDKSAGDVFTRIIKNHGVGGLYRGAVVYGFWAATRFGSAYATGDAIKSLIEVNHSRGLR